MCLKADFVCRLSESTHLTLSESTKRCYRMSDSDSVKCVDFKMFKLAFTDHTCPARGRSGCRRNKNGMRSSEFIIFFSLQRSSGVGKGFLPKASFRPPLLICSRNFFFKLSNALLRVPRQKTGFLQLLVHHTIRISKFHTYSSCSIFLK